MLAPQPIASLSVPISLALFAFLIVSELFDIRCLGDLARGQFIIDSLQLLLHILP